MERADLERELGPSFSGTLRADRLARTLYATDASIYEIVPDAVVLPATGADVAAAMRACARLGVPITARGAGTGLAGGAVNRGVILDLSRHMNRVLRVDAGRRRATVEPGVVLDELNAALAPAGLHFAPDVATSSRATIGGMIANNSCGARSILYGRTCDHVERVDVVLSDGSVAAWGDGVEPPEVPLAQAAEQALQRVVAECADEIAARYPRVLRSNAGYGLDRVRLEGGRPNVETVICGSEGTLGIVIGTTLRLEPLPACRALLLAQFDELYAALDAVQRILQHRPAAIELIDRIILNATRDNPAFATKRWFIDGDPSAILVCELFDDDAERLERRLADLAKDLAASHAAVRCRRVVRPEAQADVWAVRKAGLGLLLSRPGDAQPCAFIEDAAVDPARLSNYIRRLDALLAEEGVEEIGHHAHASVGCLHVRPVLNLTRPADIQRMQRIADRVSSLVLTFGGTLTGEHGDGIVRSAFIEKMYGPRISRAFRDIKSALDPRGLLNPGKIVAPLPLTGNLRLGEGYQRADPPTVLDFSAYGGIAGLAGMCSGLAHCRQRLVGTMCPSFAATGDETHTTRARANALRVAMSNRGLLEGLDDPAIAEVMDLCLSCKACKTECPSGVDMARMKAEWLHHRNERAGVPRRSRFIAASVRLARWGSALAPLSNWTLRSRAARVMLEHLFGLDRRMPPPPFARVTFRQWFARHVRRAQNAVRARLPGAARARVVYFADTWTKWYTPCVGMAAVRVLEALGCEVIVPRTHCCGRPLISQGLLGDAQRLAEANTRLLLPFVERGYCIVGSEPSCVSALIDELPQLVRTDEARRVAAAVRPLETFIAAMLHRTPDALHFSGPTAPLLFHGHCHAKALWGTADSVATLRACGIAVAEINSGCCGMAGAFGHEVEHYEIARAIGEQRLFPAIRARGEARIAVSGFSCRNHIEHHTGTPARHLIEYLADALADDAAFDEPR